MVKSVIISVHGTQNDIQDRLDDFIEKHDTIHTEVTSFMDIDEPITYAVVFYRDRQAFMDTLAKMIYE